MPTLLAEIEREVFSRRPALSGILQRHGSQPLKTYVKESWELPKAAPDLLFLKVLKEQLLSVYGQETAAQVADQLLNRPLVSTIDHHGIWGHPFFLNSQLIYSLRFAPEELAITFPTESVSLNNTSSWSGSLLWHDDAGQMRRASFFADRHKHLPVFSAPAISQADIKRLQKRTFGKLDRIIDSLDFKSFSPGVNFSQAASLASRNLWKVVFPSAPRMLYFPLETLVSKYLEQAFTDPQHLLTGLIMSNEGRALWNQFFLGEHTFMFWGIDNKGLRKSLIELPDKTSELLELMVSRKVYPSSPLCFAALLNAGLACVGGFTQTTWLSETKEKFADLLLELGSKEPEKPEQIRQVPTHNFAESSLAWLGKHGEYFTPTAADLLLAKKDYYQLYQNLAGQLSLEQSLRLALPTIYRVVVPKTERRGDIDLSGLEKEIFNNLEIAKHLV